MGVSFFAFGVFPGPFACRDVSAGIHSFDSFLTIISVISGLQMKPHVYMYMYITCT